MLLSLGLHSGRKLSQPIETLWFNNVTYIINDFMFEYDVFTGDMHQSVVYVNSPSLLRRYVWVCVCTVYFINKYIFGL